VIYAKEIINMILLEICFIFVILANYAFVPYAKIIMIKLIILLIMIKFALNVIHMMNYIVHIVKPAIKIYVQYVSKTIMIMILLDWGNY